MNSHFFQNVIVATLNLISRAVGFPDVSSSLKTCRREIDATSSRGLLMVPVNALHLSYLCAVKKLFAFFLTLTLNVVKYFPWFT